MKKERRLKSNEDICPHCPGIMVIVKETDEAVTWKCEDCGHEEIIEK